MRKPYLCILLFLAACLPLQTTTAVLPTEILNQYPTPMSSPTLAIVTSPIETEEKEEAFNFFYKLKNKLALGEFEHFAEEIRYPITVNVDGQPKTFIYAAEFDAS